MTEREAWLLLATHLEAIGMPWWRFGKTLKGLCECVALLTIDGLIGQKTNRSMMKRIDAARGKRFYLERPYAAKPRVKWCLKFAEESR